MAGVALPTIPRGNVQLGFQVRAAQLVNTRGLPSTDPCVVADRLRSKRCDVVDAMGLKLPPDQLALYEGIDEILWCEWDPIGVSRFDNGPRDEYQGYLPQVFQLALRAAPAIHIADYLRQVTVERMGLSASLQTELTVAEKIRALKLTLIPE